MRSGKGRRQSRREEMRRGKMEEKGGWKGKKLIKLFLLFFLQRSRPQNENMCIDTYTRKYVSYIFRE